jgi:hypothetical protein
LFPKSKVYKEWEEQCNACVNIDIKKWRNAYHHFSQTHEGNLTKRFRKEEADELVAYRNKRQKVT